MNLTHFLTEDHLRRLWPQRERFFSMPRGNPGAQGSLTRMVWEGRRRELDEARRGFLNGRLSFRTAVELALQAHLELEQYRHEHGYGQDLEHRSLLLTRRPLPLAEPDVDHHEPAPLFC